MNELQVVVRSVEYADYRAYLDEFERVCASAAAHTLPLDASLLLIEMADYQKRVASNSGGDPFGCFIVIVVPKAASLAATRCLASSPSPADSLRREVVAKRLAAQTDELQ